VPPSRLDDMALRVLTPMFRAGLFDGPAPNGREDANVTSAQHSALARSLAAAGTVLLQNRAGVLPLTAAPAVKTLLVLGDACGPAPQCCGTGSGAGGISHIVCESLASAAGIAITAATAVFLGTLVLGLAYEVKRGALEWDK